MAGGVRGSSRGARGWKRTRLGLLLFSVGLLLAWIPLVAAVGALFLTLGSTFLFMGAKAGTRRHETAVVLSYLLLTIGGVIVGVLVMAFLLQAYDGRGRLLLSSLREIAGLMVWGTLPATLAISAGFVLQVLYIVPRRQWNLLVLLAMVLVGTSVLATLLSAPDANALPDTPITTASVTDVAIRLSLYRMLEAPAYLGLAVLYLLAYWDAGLAPPRTFSPAGERTEG